MKTYTVVAGDTLYGIADKLGVLRAALVAANPQIANINLITPGQVINIPSMEVSLGYSKYALAGAAALGLGLLWWFLKGKPRKNPRGKKRKNLKRMNAYEYVKASIKPHHVFTAMQIGTALARRGR